MLETEIELAGRLDVIEPADTRQQLIMALNNLRNKKQELPPKKHGNIPL